MRVVWWVSCVVLGQGGFEAVGTDAEAPPLTLDATLSYDEIALAALLGVSVPTHFINNGDRFNNGVVAEPGVYQRRGVYMGLVGSRFERDGVMEYAHMLVTPHQNVAGNGYGRPGPARVSRPVLDLWAKFYGEGNAADGEHYFPTHKEVEDLLQSGDPEAASAYLHTGGFRMLGTATYLNTRVYKRRMRLVLEPFLMDANDRAAAASAAAGKPVRAYTHLVGLGLGVWMVSEKQGAAALCMTAFSSRRQC